MANSIEYYRKLMGTENYNTDNECKISQYVDEYNSNAQNYISSFDILINTNRASDIWLNKVNGSSGIQTKALIDYGSEYNISKLKSDMCKIQTYANILEIGGYITKKSSTDDSIEITYLTIEKEDTVEHYDIGYMQICNYTLTYKSPLDPTQIISTSCISTNATLYSLGIQETKIMSVPDGKLSIVLPDNEQTHAITRGMRFLYHGFPYKVTFIDMSTVGLIGLVLSEDVIRDEDDLVNGIAWNGGEVIVPQSDIYTLSILNNQTLTLNRWSSWQIEWEVKKNGEIINLPVTFTTSNSNVVSVNSSGLCQTTSSTGSATITVRLSSDLSVYKTIYITSVTSNATYTCEIDGASILNVGEQSRYIGVIKSSGIVQPNKEIVWEVNYNGNPTNIIKIETSLTECMIWANNVGIVGVVYLIAKYKDNPTIQFTKSIDIQMDSLW